MSEIKDLLNGISDNALSAQGTTARILLDENQRLINKRDEIERAKFGQERIIDLNRSHSKKTAAYTKAMTFAAVALGIILILRLFGGSFIPDAVFALIYIILISVSVLYGLYTYSDVNSREPTNFDRYYITPPVITVSDADKAKALASAKKTGNLLGLGSSVCAGQACCDYNQAYSSASNKCELCTGGVAGYFDKATNKCATCASGKKYDSATKACK